MHAVMTDSLLDLTRTIAAPLFAGCTFPWEAIPGIRSFIISHGMTLCDADYDNPAENVWISKSASVAKTAMLCGPLIICAGAEIRHCAFIRGSVIVGGGAVVGNSCELKNCILFEGAQVPHFNYVGDSVLGYRAHMGAGAITSNVKSDKSSVRIRGDGFDIDTTFKKLGAVLGDMAEIGCNTVLNPGSVVGRNSTVYPLVSFRGVVGGDMIVKSAGNICAKTVR